MIKERNSGVSRGFAFIDFPSVVLLPSSWVNLTKFCFNFDELTTREAIVVEQGAARTMMDRIGDDGLVVDGRKLFFEYRFFFFFLVFGSANHIGVCHFNSLDFHVASSTLRSR